MFVPGNKQRFLDKARQSEVDAVFFDLEDGVLPAEKGEARRMVGDTLGQPAAPAKFVRLNGLSTPWFAEDLEAVVRPGLDGVCLPKCESPAMVHELDARLEALEKDRAMEVGTVRVVAAIESANALLMAPTIATAHPRIMALMLGTEDMALDLGLGTDRRDEASEMLHVRSATVIAATAARIGSIDGVYPRLDDPEGARRDTEQARNLGFTGKSTFNPQQISLINEIFSPRVDEIEYAQAVVNALEDAKTRGDASVAVRGQLVDLPIVLRAQRLLELVHANRRAEPDA